MVPFTLHRAASTDLPAILDAEYESFPSPIRTLLLGTPDKRHLPRLVAHSQNEMETNPHLIWLYVRDEVSGQVVAASQWKIFVGPGWEQTGHADDKVLPWLGTDGVGTAEDRQVASGLVGRMNTRRLDALRGGGFLREYLAMPFIAGQRPELINPQPPILSRVPSHLESMLTGDPRSDLHICFTHPDYRRRGAGSMMLAWGADLADRLQLPGWIEASVEGNFLYKKHGFYDFESIKDPILGGGTNMRREPKPSMTATCGKDTIDV